MNTRIDMKGHEIIPKNIIINIDNWYKIDEFIYRFYINKHDYFEILCLNDLYKLFILNVFGREFVCSQPDIDACLVVAFYTYIQFFDDIYEPIEQSPYDEGTYNIYKLTSPENKVYIGCTRQKPEARWSRGYGYKQQPALYADIKKFGWDNFDHIIEACDLNEDDGYSLEKVIISYYKTTSPSKCYNIALGGKGAPGCVLSEEARKKIGDRSRGEKHPFFGKHLPHETRMKIREATLGPKNHFYGKKHKEESIRKFVENNPRRRMVRCVETGIIYNSIRQAGVLNRLDPTPILKSCKDPSHKKTSGGYHWEYYFNEN